MRTLIFFFWHHRFFTLFLLLETISVILLINSYSYQRSLSVNAINDITGTLFELSSNVTDYFSLTDQNKALIEENARLHNNISHLPSSKETAKTLYDSMFIYIPAKVVSNTVNKRNNYIIVDKGSRAGIEKEMAVLSQNGLVGVVIGVSPHFSLIMSMLHQNAIISARIKKNNQLVNVIWGDDNYLFGKVKDIPSHIKLIKGDTIVTSGNSLIFPRNIDIGTIENYQSDSLKSLNSATLRFATDFNSLYYVYIIKNRLKNEQQQLIRSKLP